MRQTKVGSRSILAVVISLACQVAFGSDETLITAAREGDVVTLQSLLNEKVDVNEARADGTTALSWAVYRDDIKNVDLLLRAGADANLATDYGITPLLLACENGNSDVVESLLTASADPNRAKQTGETPLMRCASVGAVEAVKALLEAGADVNAKENERGQTALMWAAAEQRPAVVRELVAHGVNLHARTKLIPELEPYEVDTPGSTVFGKNYPPTVRFPEVSGGFTALDFSAQQGDVETAHILLEAGADVNAPHPEHGSALVIAIASGHEDLAMYLLKNGADPNIKDAWGISPLHYALHEGVLMMNNYTPPNAITDKRLGWERPNMPRLVAALIDFGADPNARIEFSYAYLDNPFLARKMETPGQIDPVGATPLLLAAVSGDMESMHILEEVSDVSATTIGGGTVLMMAGGAGAERQHRSEDEALEATKFALSIGGGDVNAYLTERAMDGPARGKEDGRTLLYFAVYRGWTNLVRFLAEQGADMNVKDRYGVTPMMLALGDPEQRLKWQINGGNDHRIRGTVPVINETMVELLLEFGAQPFTGKFEERKGL
jgi:ankyrin repeat protein